MGKNKLQKFADMATYTNVFQYPYSVADSVPFDMCGHWRERYFSNSNPIILELGCGRGEYTVGLGRLCTDKNFVAVDIKGARMWTGATEALSEGLKNVAFLRTNIEIIDRFFAPDEVDEIWLTFPDPQMKRFTKRLTSTPFLQRYRHFMKDGGLVHLKTDSNFLFAYTKALVERDNLPLHCITDDLYKSGQTDEVLGIKTYYEQQWLERGIAIKYICFELPREGDIVEPDIEIPLDSYRSYHREKRSGLETSK
jgi:tRNA (guanine-N7-)-methyltransferase